MADAVADILREDGIEVLLDTQTKRAELAGEGAVTLSVATPAGERTLSGSHLLVATGRDAQHRRPESGRRGHRTLTSAATSRSTSAWRRTSPGIYAIGDVNGGPAFTHISYDDFRILRANLTQGGTATTTGRMVPYTVFIDPATRPRRHERGAGARGRAATCASPRWR